MDLYPNPTTTKSPDDSEFDTPPHTQPLPPFLSFTKNHHHHHHLSPSVVVVTYKECLKNHAASLGGHAMDGCGEFMPSPSATAGDPTSLKCAACGCHRNFHRREPNDPSPTSIIPPLFDFHYPSLPRRASPSPSPPPPPPPPPPNMLLALSMAVPDDHHRQSPATPTEFKTENQSGRKRVRTKFSQEQKEKMQSFSEKLGWKMQKCDESKVEEFCNEIGVSRGVLKIWMHNNKNNFAKKEINTGRFISFENNGQKINGDKGCDNKNSNYVQIHVSNNGSSSSSYSSDKSRYN